MKKTDSVCEGGASAREGGIPARGRGMAREGSSWPRTGVVDLRDMVVSEEIFQRGLELYDAGRVHDNGMYPWLFTVTGAHHDGTGAALYVVDLEDRTCTCDWWKWRQQPCKHMVAATARWMVREGVFDEKGPDR